MSSLETPDGTQSQQLGTFNPNAPGFSFTNTIFPGLAVGGVWKLTFEVSPGAEGWTSTLSTLDIDVEQCAPDLR